MNVVGTQFGQYNVNGNVYVITVILDNGNYTFVVANLTKKISMVYVVDSAIAKSIVSSSNLNAYLEMAEVIKSDIKSGLI
ncbi:hypothetical protein M2407_002154 [Serratia sp. BIGb0234]|uniref:hypothetical protein n=1 Tax=Serratia TaxID=613 RepID=UPI00216A7B6D|nr:MULTISPECIES: hypothetical protein [Serratia]MCS4317833.1 hypothetical protein [Serratia sp. BIGb0234]